MLPQNCPITRLFNWHVLITKIYEHTKGVANQRIIQITSDFINYGLSLFPSYKGKSIDYLNDVGLDHLYNTSGEFNKKKTLKRKKFIDIHYDKGVIITTYNTALIEPNHIPDTTKIIKKVVNDRNSTLTKIPLKTLEENICIFVEYFNMKRLNTTDEVFNENIGHKSNSTYSSN